MYLKLQRRDDFAQGTTAVDKAGNFIYNQEWVDKLSHTDLMFEIAHEVGHLFTRTMDRFPPGGHPQVWNKAADIVIDILLRDSGLPPSWVTQECTTKEEIQKYTGQSTMEVYLDLMKDPPPSNPLMVMGSPESGTDDARKCCGGSAVEKDVSKEEVIKWQKIAVSAAENAKSRGKLPGQLADWLLELTEPKVRWTDYLRVKTQETMKRKWTWRVAGRRGEAMDIRLPGKHPKLPTAVCAVDTSGSISDRQVHEFISECSEILRLTGGKMRVILFDSEVYLDGS
jgi:predicted metal-dependent peptidase